MAICFCFGIDSPEDYYVGLPFEFTNEENYAAVPQMSPVMDDGIEFWEGVIRAKDDNDVKAEEKADEMNLDLDITMSQTFSQLQLTANTCVHDAASSTDTTPILDEVNNDIGKFLWLLRKIVRPCMKTPSFQKVRVIVIAIN